MAQAIAAAAAHSMPPFPIPVGPRIRPPAIPKGTPGPNTLPVTSAPPRNGLVWTDGKWRSPRSRSAKQKQEVVSKQLERALQHEVQGMNIYAYRHIRTQQVVYSLTKNMDNYKMLKQMIFHGKKTVPEAIRRDVWRPYFSVHFPKTPAGAHKGLKVFHELRELSLRRQLSPPKELTVTTQKDVENFKRGISEIKMKEMTEVDTTKRGLKYKKLEVPVPGMRIPQRLLARRLMNQKGSSVADLAAVLTRHITGTQDKPARTPQQELATIEMRRKHRLALMSNRAHDRLTTLHKQEEEKEQQVRERENTLDAQPAYVRIDNNTLTRISTEYEGYVDFKSGVENQLDMLTQRDEETRQESAAKDAYDSLLVRIQAEKDAKKDEVERTVFARVEQEMAQMDAAERDQLQQDIEVKRAQKKAQVDAQIQEAKQELKKEKVSLRAEMEEKGRTEALVLKLRRLTRDRPDEIDARQAKLYQEEVKWVGPYAEILSKVDKACRAIDDAYREQRGALEEDATAEREQHADPANHQVLIRWADQRYATYAPPWPESVLHTDLQPKAVVQGAHLAIRQHAFHDEDEELIDEQKVMTAIPRSNTVHVFGSDSGLDGISGRYKSGLDASETAKSAREQRVQEWTQSQILITREKMVALKEECQNLESIFARTSVHGGADTYTSNVLDSITFTKESLNTFADQPNPVDLATITDNLEYARSNMSYAREEANSQRHPDEPLEAQNLELEADHVPSPFQIETARLNWMEKQVELMDLEYQNLEARREATIRWDFLQRFDQREQLQTNADRGGEQAKAALARFDHEFPLAIETLARVGSTEAAKKDQQTWLKFKKSGGMYDHSGVMSYAEEQMKTTSRLRNENKRLDKELGEMDARGVGNESLGFVGRIKRMFGR